MNKKTFIFPAAVGVAAVWFGSHAGGGFATGRQEVEFFVQFGWNAVWIGMVAMLLMGVVIYNALEFARLHDAHDYKTFFTKLYTFSGTFLPAFRFQVILPLLWDLLYLYATILGTGVAIAGASDLVHQALHIPYGIAVIIIGLILLLFTIFGAGLVRNASTAMAVFIITAILVVTYLGIKLGADNLSKVVSARTTTAGYGKILWMAILYGAFQSVLIAPIVSVSDALKTRKSSLLTALFGFLVNGTMLILVCIMLLSFFPAIVKENLPVYYVTAQLGHKWLYALYCLILFFALISTGVGFVFGAVKRFELAWKKENRIFKNIRTKRIAICLACLVVSGGISLFGLTAIVAKGYGSLGILSIFFTIIPLLILAPIKNRKARSPQRGDV